MPRATNNTEITERHELKTLPATDGEEGGFVEVRRLSYGQKLQRRAMVSRLKLQSERGKKNFDGEMQLVNEQATLFDFKNCIVDHNLEDAEGNKLDFSNILVVKSLDPRVGEEIDQILDELNNYEEDEGN